MFAQFSSFLLCKCPSFLCPLCIPCLLILSLCPLSPPLPLSVKALGEVGPAHCKPSDSLSVLSCHLDLFWAYFLFLSPTFPNHLCCLHQSGPLSPVLSFLPWVSLPHLPLLPFLSFNLSLNLPSFPHLSTLLLYDFLVVSTSEFSVSLCLNAS